EPGQVLRGIGNGRFAEVSAQTGTFGSVPRLDRSLAFGDLDGDGDVDLVASDLSGRVRIFRNDAPPKSRGWLKVKAFEGPLEALGAIVAVEADGKVRRRPFLRAYGYAASHEAVAHFGLGRARRYERVEILWPSGGRERFPGGEANRTVVLRRGEGEALAAMSAHEEPGR
ncbi:MAG TPA: ASPIC/UnbV domain-containing protein, partial [Planctomycetota bacterium]|nr:ASPIC/UnbV domain-containing protein [Planctomycetota bacterium]